MKLISTLVMSLALASCAGLSAPDAKDAKQVLDAAVAACAFRDSLPAPAKDACDKLDHAANATREAAESVLAVVPEAK